MTEDVKYLRLGYRYLQNDKFGRAFTNFIQYLENNGERKKEVEEAFFLALTQWTLKLHNENKLTQLINCYSKALQFYPQNLDILTNFGNYLLKLNYEKEASTYFLAALDIDPTYLPAKTGLQAVCNKMVECWHFRMLNDYKRNIAFKNAIDNATKNGCNSVLDIGTGTGIFAMTAAKSVENVYGCEENNTMCSLAKNVIFQNGLHSKVKLLEKSSLNLKIPNDIPNKVNLVISEILDAGVFGENILRTLHHAWNDLLNTNDQGLVIPHSAKIFISAIESSYIARHSRLINTSFIKSIFPKFSIVCETECPYNLEMLQNLPGTYKSLTDPQCIYDMNFNDPNQIADVLTSGFQQLHRIKVLNHGHLDAVMLWFHLKVSDGIFLSTHPEEGSCWEQVIFPSIEDRQVLKSDEIYVDVFMKENIQVKIISKCSLDNQSLFHLPQDVVAFLNDEPMTQAYLKEIHHAINSKARTSVNILELGPFPCSLSLLKDYEFNLTVCCDSDSTVEMIQGLRSDKVQLIPYDALSELQTLYDIITIHPVQPNGTLKDQVLQNLYALITCCLKPGGSIIPNSINVFSQGIECDILLEQSRILGKDRTLGFEIGEVMNNFTVPTFLDIPILGLPHVALTNEIKLASFELNNITNLSNCSKMFNNQIQIVEKGDLVGFMIWFELLFKQAGIVSTLRSESNCKQSVLMIHPSLPVKKHDLLDANIVIENSDLFLQSITPH